MKLLTCVFQNNYCLNPENTFGKLLEWNQTRIAIQQSKIAYLLTDFTIFLRVSLFRSHFQIKYSDQLLPHLNLNPLFFFYSFC